MANTKLLRDCLQGMMLLEDRFDRVEEEDAAWICERLRWHKLMPLAASLHDPQRPKCATLGAAFQAMLIQNMAREQHYYNQVKEIFALLEQNGIKFTPYKGPFWGTQVYPQYSWRHIGDIDVIMSVDAARRAAVMLDAKGYQLEVLGETMEDDLRVRGELTCHAPRDAKHLSPVQLHWELMPAPRFLKRHFLTPEDFAANATEAQWKSLRYSLPAPEVRFLYHVLHATCQHQFNRFVLVADMALFIRKHPGMNWQRLYDLAKERACLAPLYYGLSAVDTFCDIAPEARDIMRRARPDLRTRLVAGWLTPASTLHYNARRGRTRRKLFRVAMSW